jgi:RNA recognition motif-containing protein
MNLYVGNLSFQTDENQLSQLFAQHGEVLSARVISDRDTGRSRGFGFVEMASRSEGEKAIQELNSKDIDGRQIKVNESKPRKDNNRGPRY